jgi:2-oxoacid:acceptor oxidoreductase delta subunit (pyruvate/2-ketoisovalerate family)
MNKPFAITLDVGSSLVNKTGSWRTFRPQYVSRLPPCNRACPAGENTQAWLGLMQEGEELRAWQTLTQDNPFPAVMGRVCYHPCEGACNRGSLEGSVGINAVEQFLGDRALEQGWAFERPQQESGRSVMIVGAGPSGLAAAYHLRRLGHPVTVFDAASQAGGMMRYGIPQYRLPRQVLDAEIARIVAMGVELRLNTPVSALTETMQSGDFDAAFVAVGAHRAKAGDAQLEAGACVLDAVSLLRQMEDGQDRPVLGRRVAVYGGGNTAIDVARTARRLGAAQVTIIYRRTRETMPAHDFEVAEALEEGISVRWLTSIRRVEAPCRLTLGLMRLNDAQRAEATGEEDALEVDTLVLALGQDADLSLLDGLDGVERANGVVTVDETMMTGRAGVFAGGDMVPAVRSVTVAIGHGKKAARNIDAWLRNEISAKAPRNADAEAGLLNTYYYPQAPRIERTLSPAQERVRNFAAVVSGLSEDEAVREARRCMSCGNCLECDNCYGMCPDNAIVKLGQGNKYRIDYEYCKGCGICAQECPCGAIEMVAETF